MKKELVEDAGDSWHSLILDESTDKTAVKQLAVLVRYYSLKHKELLGLIEPLKPLQLYSMKH